MNHRDCYLCHFLLATDTVDEPTPRIHVIDLHRAQIRSRIPARWREKDLAGLAFSALDFDLTRTDFLRFVRTYEDKPLPAVFNDHATRWKRVRRKALRLYRKEFGRPAPIDL